jgi:lipopolysaccharide export system protein LptA
VVLRWTLQPPALARCTNASILLACSLLLLAPAARAQPAASASDTLIINAEHGILQREGNDSVELLDGDVRVVRGTTTILSQRARKTGVRGDEHVFFYENVRVTDRHVTMTGEVAEYRARADWAEMQQNVVIQDSTGVIHAQRARYYRQQRVMWLWGNVEFTDPTTRVLADSIKFDEVSGLGEAFGNVVLQDLEGGSEARGPHGFYDRKSGEAWLAAKPTLVLRDEDGTETRVFATEEARRNPKRRDARARGDVRIERGEMVAEADSALIDEAKRVLQLRGNPRVAEGDARISGRDIDVFFGSGDTIERVVVRRNARLVQARTDTLLIPDDNVVRGDSATIFFRDGKLDRAVVAGRASSTFVPDESRPNRIAMNDAESDSIICVFKDDEIEEVIFIGNATGTYRFYEGDLQALRAPKTASIDTTFGVVRGDTTRFEFRREAETVEYSAERILYLTTINDLHLQDGAEVRYQGRTLQAGRIQFDADPDVMVAHEQPVLIEGGDRIYGREMGYDMAQRDSWVQEGSTEYDQGYYHGERILRKPDGTLYVDRGQYTSCDLAEAHYGFRAKQMKIYLHDKVIGRPVLLYLGNIPMFYLPFFFSSTSTDRRSGFLQPIVEVGLGTRSRYIRGLDYYWAASDYWDVLFSSDYSERDRVDRSSVGSVLADTAASRNVRLAAHVRYKVRYKLDGNIDFSQSYDLDSGNKSYILAGNHNHDISRATKISATFNYASNDVAIRRNYVNTDYDRSRQRQLSSAVTFRHSADLGNVNLGLTRTQIVAPDESFINGGAAILRWTQPSAAVTFRSIRLAPRPRNPRDASFLQRFLSELQFAPNLNFSRSVDTFRRRRFLDANTGVVVPDTTGVPDSLLVEDIYEETLESLRGSTRIGLGRQANLWIFNLTPSVGYSESYTRTEGSTDPELRDGKFTRSFDAGAGAATRFFGIFKPGFGRLSALRHTLEPRANYSYSIASDQDEGRHFVSLSLANRLDIKYEDDGKEVRHDGVIDWSLSGSYNPQADKEWSTVSSRLTLNRQGPFRVDISQTYDPYKKKITSTQIPFALRLSGRLPSYEPPVAEERLNRVAEEEGPAAADADSLGPNDRWGFQPDLQTPLTGVQEVGLNQGGGPLGWDLGLSYSLRRENGETLRANVSVALGVQPTRNWRVRYGAYYDVASHELTNPAIRIERDMHCWTASFSRVYSGFDGEWRYYFRIHVKKHQEDLFFESGDRGFGS